MTQYHPLQLKSALFRIALLAFFGTLLVPCVGHARESLSTLRADVDQNTGDIADVQDVVSAHGRPVYRWQVFDTYLNGYSWVMGNNPDLFGGISPSNWTDSNYRAVNMSPDPDILGALLTRRGTGRANAMIYSEVFYQYSSTTGRVVVVLFRIRNTTAGPIVWQPSFYYSCYAGYGERAGVAVNGTEVWSSGSLNCGSNASATVSLSIPANATSTVIFSSPSSAAAVSPANSTLVRATLLGFYNSSLNLPAGLEYVDDLDQQDAPLW